MHQALPLTKIKHPKVHFIQRNAASSAVGLYYSYHHDLNTHYLSQIYNHKSRLMLKKTNPSANAVLLIS